MLQEIKQPISIIVVTYNRLKYFKTFLSSLYSSTKYPFKLITVDNGSVDRTREYILEKEKDGLIWKHVFNSNNLPLAAALSEGFKVVDTELFITVADDMCVNPLLNHDWLEIFIKRMEDKEIGCINFCGARCHYDSYIKKYVRK